MMESPNIDDCFRNFVLLGASLELVETESLLPSFCELFEPGIFLGDKGQETFLLLFALSLLFVFEEVDTFVVHFFVFLTHLLLAVDQSTLFLIRQLGQKTGSPVDVEDVLLECVLSDDFTDEVPNLVALFSSQKNEAARGVDVEEVHSIYNQVLLGKFEGKHSFAFFLCLTSDQAQ